MPDHLSPQKQGVTGKDAKGNLVLINPEGQAYSINREIEKVWNYIDGRNTIKSIAENLGREMDWNFENAYATTKQLLEKLGSVHLIRFN